MMKAARIHSPGDLRLHDEPVPIPGPGEALVRVGGVGICGSDLNWFSNAAVGGACLDHPLVLGHEIAGWTESGQLVAVDPCIPCGQCEYCLSGMPNLCPTQRFAGFGAQDGGLREFMAWPQRCLVPLPDSFIVNDGVMLESLGVAIHALDLARVQPMDIVGIFGLGPIGQCIAQMSVNGYAGLVIATEKRPHRLEMVSSLGIPALLADGREVAIIHKITRGRGLDLAIEVAGEQSAVDSAIEALRPGGRLLLAGIPPRDETIFCASLARGKGLTVQWVRRMKYTYRRAIELIRSGRVDVRSLVTHAYPLEAVSTAFSRAYQREGMKVIVQM